MQSTILRSKVRILKISIKHLFCRLVKHAFPPQFSGRLFLGWSMWQVDPRGGFIGRPEPWNDQQCQGPQALQVGFRNIFVGLAINLAVLSQRLGRVGEGQEVLRREKKKLQFAFGCLESSFLEGQLKSDRCLDIYFKGCREVQMERQP